MGENGENLLTSRERKQTMNASATTIPTMVQGRPVPSQQQCKAKTWQRVSPEFRTPNQSLGQRIAIGCVSLEITQRCNLDCTLCYLSDMSEKTLDVPMEELKRRVDEILLEYGVGTGIQVSGGDPTLRKEEELIEIVRYISSLGMQPALLTNGIKATRELLTKLAAVGLMDVAFHVDMTQQLRRPDKTYYQSEEELNVIRQEYIERARGLGIAVIFNTTLFPGNFHELPMLVRFFKDNADVVGMCSFQLGADTGRGVHRGREQAIEPRNIIRIVNQALDASINFDAIDIGHPECNRIGYSLVSNKRAYDLWWDPTIINKIAKGFEGLTLDRGNPKKAIKTAVLHVLKKPKLLLEGLRFVGVHAWRMKWDLIASGFKAYKLSFFIHNFMHADSLDQCRIDNCSFMVMTADGPVSMCAHNAVRNDYITKEVTVQTEDGSVKTFNPVREQFREEWERRKALGQTAPIIPERRKKTLTKSLNGQS
jgi:sulfatase maturation enzyme AslB (radical SAM superfamily)